MSFTGWPEEALDFYEGLRADGSKAYWTDHRDVYETCVRAPFTALVAELEPEFGPFKVFRPYRDVRFSRDRTPYKDHQGAVREGVGALYVQVSADGLLLAGGGYALATDQARRLRAAVADARPGQALLDVLRALEGDGFAVGGDRLVRVPVEHRDAVAEDDPRRPLLRARTLVATQQHDPAPWLHTADAREVVVRAFRALEPLNAWLGRHVGPSRT